MIHFEFAAEKFFLYLISLILSVLTMTYLGAPPALVARRHAFARRRAVHSQLLTWLCSCAPQGQLSIALELCSKQLA